MKKIVSIFMVTMLICSLFINPVYANEVKQENKASFEITDIMDYAQVYGVRSDTAVVKIPVNLDIGNGISTELLVTVLPQKTRASGTLNVNVKGNFQKTSNKTVVTLYGLDGSFEYTGKDTKITGNSSYHSSALKGWSGTHSTSTEYHASMNHISVLAGDYTCYEGSKQSSTAWIRIAVSENGNISVGGDYISYTTK